MRLKLSLFIISFYFAASCSKTPCNSENQNNSESSSEQCQKEDDLAEAESDNETVGSSISITVISDEQTLAKLSIDIGDYLSSEEKTSDVMIKLSLAADFSGADWIAYAKDSSFQIDPSLENCTERTLYLAFKDKSGVEYGPLSATFTGACWKSIATAGAPSARFYHSGVWTGTKMLVFGGHNSSGTYLNDGGMYDPATDSWTAISTVGAPARTWHSAVWAQDRMLVFGGRVDNSYEKTLYSYVPATETWTALASAPINARYGHVAVWTGSKMIVWGGSDSGQWYTDGAAYDPDTNQWSLISSVNAPSSRYGAQAVWTGSKMIVWGGHEPVGSDLPNGAIYDPQTDSWTPLAGPSNNLGRSMHSAIWTGSEMMVWGGWFGSPFIGSFQFYNPSTDTWREVAEVPGYTATERHSTVWTGSSMIVWGGNIDISASALDTGAILKPSFFTKLTQ